MASTPSAVAESGRSAQAASVVSPDNVTTSQMRMRMRELEEDSKNYKRCKLAIGSVAEEFECPITTELPVDPVTAEDGRIYERSAIEKHIATRRDDLKSPATNAPMGPKLLPAVQVRNTINTLIESGTIDGGIATRWKERLKTYKKVKEKRKKAEEGDTDAMCYLGDWYYFGKNGLQKDYSRAYEWYKKAADLYSVRGMAEQGFALLNAKGVERNISYGQVLLSTAAGMGSDMGAWKMGEWHKDGGYGLPVDKAKAKYWLGKVVDGSCGVKHLLRADLKIAKQKLEELEDTE